MLRYQFSTAGLNGKIALCKSNFFFFRITILRNEIASIASEHKILDFTLRSTAKNDHFRDLTKMVICVDILRLA